MATLDQAARSLRELILITGERLGRVPTGSASARNLVVGRRADGENRRIGDNRRADDDGLQYGAA